MLAYTLLAKTYKAIKWFATLVKGYAVWLAAHPVTTISTGVGLLRASGWLSDQRWAGATVLAELTGAMGIGLVNFGLGAFVSRTITKASFKALKTIPSPVYKGIPLSYILPWLGFGLA